MDHQDDPTMASGAVGADDESPASSRHVGRVHYPKWVWAFGFIGAAIMLACFIAIGQLNDSNATDTGGGAIERLVPAARTQILSQSEVGVDLAPGYTAELSLNGFLIADDEVKRVEATNSVLFLPAPGRSVEEFTPGENCMTARYWKLVDGEGSARTAAWCFEVL